MCTAAALTRAQLLALFGSAKQPWRPADWRAVDDRVRGGSSQSHLSSDDGWSARFYGTLDTSTLGGAGFASQTTERALRLPRSHFSGLRIEVLRDDAASLADEKRPTSFVFNLKTTAPERRPDGRLESRVTYEYEFDGAREGPLDAPWSAFEATYRGRPAKDAPPLDPAAIVEVSIMCRSGFDRQRGDFSVRLGRVSAVRTAADNSVDAEVFGTQRRRGVLAWARQAMLAIVGALRNMLGLGARSKL